MPAGSLRSKIYSGGRTSRRDGRGLAKAGRGDVVEIFKPTRPVLNTNEVRPPMPIGKRTSWRHPDRSVLSLMLDIGDASGSIPANRDPALALLSVGGVA
jgi:hypothetical protein